MEVAANKAFKTLFVHISGTFLRQMCIIRYLDALHGAIKRQSAYAE